MRINSNANHKTRMPHKMKMFLSAVTLLILPTGAKAQEVPITPPSADELASPKWIETGKELFTQSCAYCHGMKGDAGKTKSFTERQGWPAKEIFDVISNGRTRGANKMPAWKGAIPDEDIWKIVAYIKSLSADNE